MTETVELADWHIIIFANRRINRGEELSYDYKVDSSTQLEIYTNWAALPSQE